jgi:hypothetical protein
MIVRAVTFVLAGIAFAVAGMPALPAAAAPLSAWAGKSPLATIDGQSIFGAAGYGHEATFNDTDWLPTTTWSAVSELPMAKGSGKRRWTDRAYVFTQCGSDCRVHGSALTTWVIVRGRSNYLLRVDRSPEFFVKTQFCMYGDPATGDRWSCKGSVWDPVPEGTNQQRLAAIADMEIRFREALASGDNGGSSYRGSSDSLAAPSCGRACPGMYNPGAPPGSSGPNGP